MSTPEAATKKALDQIDNYSISAAENTLEAALGKWPDSVDLKVAHSLLLLRQGSVSEAAAQATSLSKKADSLREGTINVLSHVLQQTCCHSELATVYERTVTQLGGPDAKESTSAQENLLSAYVLSGTFPAAQKLAMLLQKKTGKHEYLIKAMMCNIAQVPDGVTDHMLLKIATKMIFSTLNGKHCLHPQTCQMYVNALIQQLQFTEAVAFVASDLGKHFGLPEQRYAQLLKCLDAELAYLEMGPAADASSKISETKLRIAAVARQGWASEPDSWTFIERYVKAVESLVGSPATTIPFSAFPSPHWDQQLSKISGGAWAVDTSFGDALAFAVKQQTSGGSGSKCLRGPHMAEIKILLSRLRKESPEASPSTKDQLMQKAISYARTFAQKGTCYLDLATLFSDSAFPSAIEAVIDDLKSQDVAEDEAKAESTSDQIKVHRLRILRLKLQLFIADFTKEYPDAEKVIAECIANYNACKPFSMDLEWSEEGLVDGYLLIVANIAARQWNLFAFQGEEDKGNSWLLAALYAFSMMDRKKNNPGTLLFSTLFYQQFDIADTASLSQLDFKAIQHTSMHPVACQPLLRGMAFADLKTYFTHAKERFYDFEKKEMATLQAKIFQHLSWPKMAELKSFENRLLRGLPRQEALVYNAVVKLHEAQTIKYIAGHAVKASATVQNALASVCIPSKYLGETAAAGASQGGEGQSQLTIAALWDAIDSVDETLPEDDEQFLMAYVFADFKSAQAKDMTNRLLDKDSRRERRYRAVLAAIGMILLHDVAVFEAKKTVAAAAATPAKGKKGSTSTPAPVPFATEPSLIKKYGITSASIKGLKAPSSLANQISVLAAMAELVEELETALSGIASSGSGKVVMDGNSPARVALSKALTDAATTLTGNVATPVEGSDMRDSFNRSGHTNAQGSLDKRLKVNKNLNSVHATWLFVFPIGIIVSAFLTLMPCPAEVAKAFLGGLLKNFSAEVKGHVRVCEATSPENPIELNLANLDSVPLATNDKKAIVASSTKIRVSNLRSLSALIDDLSADVEACTRRKQ